MKIPPSPDQCISELCLQAYQTKKHRKNNAALFGILPNPTPFPDPVASDRWLWHFA